MNSGLRAAAVIGTAVLLSLSTPVQAVPIEVSTGGVFVDSQSSIAVGTQWSLDLVYETSTPDTLPGDPAEGLYNAYQWLQLTVGDQIYTLADLVPERANVRVFDDRPSNDGDGETFRDVVGFGGSVASTLYGFSLLASFGDAAPGGGVLGSDALIADPLQLTSLFTDRQSPFWQFTDFVFYEMQPGETTTSVFAIGSVDRFSAAYVSVPEPGTLVLLSLGLLMMRWRRTLRIE
ncbi:hypothetical protein HNQ60_005239 [Povalibacter uvarum]|uniref:Ice-binding protein C-terminal domain-containing protein n=1 Tax=Povalibacter uvarum TaxID=732238 RepID=A0A841HSM3_9GAMM|nr:PEP-CTERM sorting domain-containing protein [Povalibacter uvarum]MBB6096317.1 hypothetical protein [Povalibacter uvarum]